MKKEKEEDRNNYNYRKKTGGQKEIEAILLLNVQINYVLSRFVACAKPLVKDNNCL